MARFYFSLSPRSHVFGLNAAMALSLAIISASSLQAQPSMVPPPEKAPVAPPVNPPAAVASTPVPKPSPPAPPKVELVPDNFNRYGKIWTTSDDVQHPLKLSGRFPGVNEIKIPTQDELNDRDKLEQLAMLSDNEIRTQLEQWPPYSKMKLGDQGQMLLRIQQFREQRTRMAMDKAHDLGIYDSLTPDQKEHFEQAYWDVRRQMDHDEVKQMEPILKTWEQKLDEDLFRKFSSSTTVPGAPPAKPPVPPAPNKPGQASVTPTTSTAAANHPLAQSP